MEFKNIVGLIEFGNEVRRHFSDEYDSVQYRVDIADILLRHKAWLWPSVDLSHMPDLWKTWLLEAQDQDWLVGKARYAYAFTPHTIRDLSKGAGLLERAITIHYRLHRSIEESELELASEMDHAVFGKHSSEVIGKLFEVLPSLPVSFDGVNSARQLAQLDSCNCSELDQMSSYFELSAELFCRQVSHRLGHRRLRYGLREVWFRVTTQDFDVVEYYRGGQRNQPRHLHFHGNRTWKINASDGPVDNFGMLDGSVLSGPICSGLPLSKNDALLEVEVYVSKTTPKLSILADTTDDEVTADEQERKNLIEKMFTIYLHKLNRLDGEYVILSSKGVQI